MRTFAIMIAAAVLAALSAGPAKAVGTDYPFCLQGDEYPGLSNCTFSSYEQCQATASGRYLSCIANPYFTGQSDDPYAYQNRDRPWPAPRFSPRY